MRAYTKFILLNAGTRTRAAFRAGLGSTPSEWYHTKHMLLHIKEDGSPRFLYDNTPLVWEGARVFTRLRASDQQFCGILYDYFAHSGILTNDPINASYVNSAEKISQMLRLALHGVPIPETFIFREESFEKNRAYIDEHLSFPLVFKTDGSKGKNVHVAERSADLERLVAEKKPNILALVQPFIPNTFDTRTIVVFGNVLGTIARTRAEGYLNNIAQGAVAGSYQLSDNERSVAINAAQVTHIDIAGVDMIHTEKGPLVIEVNKSPQVGGFESVYGIRVFEKVAEIMKSLS